MTTSTENPADQHSYGSATYTEETYAGERPVSREGPITRALEEQKLQIPNDTFLWAAVSSIALSLTLRILDRRHDALFVGQWAPTLLLLGIHNRLAKTASVERR